MGRMRTMKPEFFKSRSLAKLPRDARMTYVGLWTEADDHGNGIADARLLKGTIWPLDDDIEPLHVSAFLRMLAASTHIQLYTVGDETYFHIINFFKHQAAAYRRGEPKYPGPSAGQPLDPDPARESVQESAERTPPSAGTGNREQGTRNRDLGAAPESHSPAPPRGRGASGPQATAAYRLVDDTLGRRELTAATRTALAIEVTQLLLEVDPPEIAEGLKRWSRRTGIGPRVLAGLVDDVRKEARGATSRAAPTPAVNATDAFAEQFLAAGQHAQPALRALPGGA